MRISTIVPEALQESIMMDRLKELKQDFLFNEEIISFNTFCARLKSEENEVKELLVCGKVLDQHADDFVLYQSMLKYPAFIDQVYSFGKELAKAQVNRDDLKTENELKDILKKIPDYSKWVDNQKKIDEALDQAKNCHVLVVDNDYFAYQQLVKLALHNEEIKLAQCKVEKKSLKTGINVANECEGVIQDILKRKIELDDALVILTDFNAYFETFEAVAKLYQLPLDSLAVSQSSAVIRFFSSAIRLYCDHSVDNLKVALANHVFDCGLSDQMKSYLDMFIKSADELLDEWDIVEKNIDTTEYSDIDKKTYCHIEEVAKSEKEIIVSDLKDLFDCPSPIDVLSFIYSKIVHKSFLDEEEITVLLNVKKDIEACAEILTDDKDLERFLYCLEKRSKRVKKNCSGLKVTDMNHPVTSKKVVYILGCSSDYYPGFKPLKGIFDEAFVEGCGYPSLKERVDFHQKKIDWIHHSGEEIIYSYCCSDYQGKEKEAAYGIESLFKGDKASLWTVEMNNEKVSHYHALSADLAESLFIKDNKLNGSVSSFERYFNCPYSYFLKTGLKLNTTDMKEIDAAIIGTIQHAVMETAINTRGKAYGEITRVEIEEEVHRYFEPLKKLFVKKAGIIGVVEKRMIAGLVLAFDYLRQMEEATAFVPAGQEAKFSECLLSYDGVTVNLNGIIDRYDLCGDSLRIVDYKSSDKELSRSKVDAGLQLQLLSYLIIAVRKYKKKAMGAYYFSLKVDNVDLKAGKVDSKKGDYIEATLEEAYQAHLKTEKLSGWTFDDPRFLDSDGSHVTGLSFKNEEVTCKQKDYPQMEAILTAIYCKLIEGLKSGDTEIHPVKGACQFCDFKPICRFKGDEFKIEPVIENGYTGGKESEDEME